MLTAEQLNTLARNRDGVRQGYYVGTRRPLAPDYQQTGGRGEIELCRVFGGDVDIEPRKWGDGGFDVIAWLYESASSLRPARPYRIDVKCSKPRPRWFLVKPECFEYRMPADLYVTAWYDERNDKTHLLKWQTAEVMRRQPIADKPGHGVLSHWMMLSACHDMRELTERLAPRP